MQLNREACTCCEIAEADLALALATLDAQTDFPVAAGELSIVLMDEAPHCELHQRFFGDPSPTDVITFPGDPEDDFAGEIIINAEQALKVAARYGQTPADELALYLVHGWLHLAGLDDQSEMDRGAMREGERALLWALKAAGTLPPFQFGRQ
ncbi:MAG: rRNA maturation RNase YbeY [Opitutales bacterium]